MKQNRGQGRPKNANIRLHVAMEPDLYAKLMERAAAENRPLSNMLNVILRKILIANASKAA